MAYLAGKYSLAGKELAALHWQPAPDELTRWKLDPELLPLEIAARTGVQSNAITTAEIDRDRGDLAGALKDYRDLATVTNLDARTRSFVTERAATLDLETRLQTHEWVDWLPSDTNFSGWRIEEGSCKLNPDGSLEVQSGTNGHQLYSLARVGPDIEVRGQFEVVPAFAKSYQAGLVIGAPRIGTVNWYSFRMKRTEDGGDTASFERHWSEKGLHAPASLDHVTNTFYFRYQDHKVSATVNDQVVFTEAAPLRAIQVATNNIRLGLGAFTGSTETVIRYRNVQARLPENKNGFQLTPYTK